MSTVVGLAISQRLWLGIIPQTKMLTNLHYARDTVHLENIHSASLVPLLT